MSQRCVQVIAVEGDRWDSIAHRCYGDPLLVEPIIRANPSVPIRPTIAAGTVVFVPVLDDRQISNAATLPPWKRAT